MYKPKKIIIGDSVEVINKTALRPGDRGKGHVFKVAGIDGCVIQLKIDEFLTWWVHRRDVRLISV